MIQTSRVKMFVFNKYLQFVVVAVVLSFSFLHANIANAATAANLPRDLPKQNASNPAPTNSLYYVVSAGDPTDSNSSNKLYSPTVWLKVYANNSGGGTVRFVNGNQCPNTSGFDGGAAVTHFEFFKTTADEDVYYQSPSPSLTSTQGATTNPAACGDVVMTIPSGSMKASDVPGHEGLYVGIIKIYIKPSSPTSDGPLNAFRVVSSSTIGLGSWSGQGQSGGLVPSLDGSQSIIGRPNSMNTDTYDLEFKPPCTYWGTDSSKTIRLKWFDDDKGTTYQQPDPVITIYEQPESDGGAPVGSDAISYSSLNWGGEGREGSLRMTVKKGKKYTWRWSNITRKNGVQVFFEFDSGDFDIGCPVFTDAGCAIQNPGDVPTQVKINQVFNVRLVVGNNGSTSWGSTFKLGSGGEDPSDSGNPKKHDNIFWQASSNGGNAVNSSGTRVTLTGYPVPGSSGSDDPSLVLPALRIVTFKVKAPSTPGQFPFWWQVVQEGVGWRGQACKQTIQVTEPVNRPYIQIEGSDVISGANFTDNGVCSVNNVKADKANIATNGYHGNQVLNSLNGTSNAQYAVFASGEIGDDNFAAINTFRGNFGYRRNPVGTIDDVRDALFATTNLPSSANTYGHFYNDNVSNPPLPCIDVSGDRAAINGNLISGTSAQIKSLTRTNILAGGTGTVGVNGDLTIDALTVPLGAHKTIVVSGSVTITGNVLYSAGYAPDTIPYLKIIAKNIYIQANAQQIDANLFAVPDTTVSPNTYGIIDTCSNMGGTAAGQWPTSMTIGSCRRTTPSLLINGEVVARRILWKRTFGTLGTKDGAANAECYLGNYTDNADTPKITGADTAVQRGEKCAAELIRFSPEAYLSGFSQNRGTLGVVPQSSQELPPIY